ncbi:hypothetical protein [Sphingomonas sp. TREG-RG-20F-R18-01]|uniref:hypothetical protein n=1 Tax=Sphingomonas sp. TREG-RG-20F-R18-01 TaxID=2914982 RepID=UPI001F5AE2F6|nr:hypothetical protein [Sphingomonas sp. TREG-RG-20F-R18-01]
MSIDTAIAELNTNILALVAALKVTGENQERLIAGQGAAIAKVEAPKRTRRTKEEIAADDAAAAATGTASTTEADTGAKARTVSDEELRAIAPKYLNGTVDDATKKREFMQSMMAELGTSKLCGPESKLDADARLRAAFYLERKAEGLPVDFSAEYDFNGDPTQPGSEPAEDDFGV